MKGVPRAELRGTATHQEKYSTSKTPIKTRVSRAQRKVKKKLIAYLLLDCKTLLLCFVSSNDKNNEHNYTQIGKEL